MNSPKRKAATRKRVLIVDDHPVLRRGVVEMLAQEPDLTVCGEASDVHEALQAVEELKPDLVLVDITLKNSNGLELLKDLRTRWPNLPALVLSMHDETLYAERALRAGARGYVAKGEPPARVMQAVRQVLNGEVYVSERLASKLLYRLVNGQPGSGRFSVEALSDREFEVFRFIGEGRSTRDIAERLHLSVKTIESHRENIKRKLKLKNASELLQHAIQWVQYEKQS